MKRWLKQHYVGEYTSPPDVIRGPDISWGARRGDDQDHLANLKESFCRTGTVNERNLVIAEKGRSEDVEGLFDIEVARQNMALKAFGGDHTRIVMTQLKNQYPRNQLWKNYRHKTYHMDSVDPHNIRMLRLQSNLDNYAAGVQLQRDLWTIITTMHDFLIEDAKRLGRAATTEEVSAMKGDLAYSSKLPLASVGQLFQLSKYMGDTWNKLRAIFTGDVRNPKFKRPKSCSNFVMMAGIPEETLQSWMDLMVTGNEQTKDFKNRCRNYKSKTRILCRIVDIATQTGLHDPAGEVESYEEFQLKFPLATQQAFVASWVGPVAKLKKKDVLPPSLIKAINERLARDVKQNSLNEVYTKDMHLWHKLADVHQYAYDTLLVYRLSLVMKSIS